MGKAVTIYVLHDGDGRPRYLGATVNPTRRRGEHLAWASFFARRATNPPMSCLTSALHLWMETTVRAGRNIVFSPLETVPADEAARTENLWMVLLRAEGHALTNSYHSRPYPTRSICPP